MKISEIKGLLPAKSNGVCACDCLACHANNHAKCEINGSLCHQICCCDNTWNDAINQISSKEIEVEMDREALAKFLFYKYAMLVTGDAIHKIKVMSFESLTPTSRQYWLKDADALIAAKHSFTTIRVIK
jgi:hypothetical protein